MSYFQCPFAFVVSFFINELLSVTTVIKYPFPLGHFCFPNSEGCSILCTHCDPRSMTLATLGYHCLRSVSLTFWGAPRNRGLVFVYLLSMNTYDAKGDGKMKVLISVYALDSTKLRQWGRVGKTSKWKPNCRKKYVNPTINKIVKNHSGQARVDIKDRHKENPVTHVKKSTQTQVQDV